MDIPNARSSHKSPKPRTGGIAIFVAFISGVAIWPAIIPQPPITYEKTCIVVGAAAFFLLGLLEDIRHLPEWFRFMIQASLSLVVASFGPRLNSLEIPGLGACPLAAPLAVGITAFWYTGFVNLFNFLDGLDGYAAGEAAILGVMMATVSEPVWPLLVSAAAVGFLLLNRQPSRIFMGDSGSYLLGFLVAVLSVSGASPGRFHVPFAVYLLFSGTFIADASVTLLRRSIRGERWYEAHRSHYYQKLTDLGFSHMQVCGMNILVTLLLGMSGWIYIRSGMRAQYALLCGWSVLFAMFIFMIHKREAMRGRTRHQTEVATSSRS